MEFFLEISLVGLAVGGVYSLIALGYVLVYRTTRVVNFAHGNLMMFGAYFFFTFAVLLELPWWAALPLSIGASALLGAGIERVLMRPLLRREATVAVLATVGLAAVLHGLVQMIWTPRDYLLPSIFPERPIVMGGMYIPANTGFGALVALAAVGVFLVLFRITRLGLAMRAHRLRSGRGKLAGHRRPGDLQPDLGLRRRQRGARRGRGRLDHDAQSVHGSDRAVRAGGRHPGRPGQPGGSRPRRPVYRLAGGGHRLLPWRVVQGRGAVRGAAGHPDVVRPHGLLGTPRVERL